MTTSRLHYHGTDNRLAYAIMRQGFKIGEMRHGRVMGRGLYITQRLENARFWSHDIVIKCRLESGTRILWIETTYDQSVVDALAREFGRELLTGGPNFTRAIPPNKHLTARELIALCNYLVVVRTRQLERAIWPRSEKRMQAYYDMWDDLSSLHTELKRHGYDAIGNRTFAEWDSDEIVVFNPSRVTPVSAHWLKWIERDDQDIVTISDAIELEALAEISAQSQLEYDAEEEADEEA